MADYVEVIEDDDNPSVVSAGECVKMKRKRKKIYDNGSVKPVSKNKKKRKKRSKKPFKLDTVYSSVEIAPYVQCNKYYGGDMQHPYAMISPTKIVAESKSSRNAAAVASFDNHLKRQCGDGYFYGPSEKIRKLISSSECSHTANEFYCYICADSRRSYGEQYPSTSGLLSVHTKNNKGKVGRKSYQIKSKDLECSKGKPKVQYDDLYVETGVVSRLSSNNILSPASDKSEITRTTYSPHSDVLTSDSGIVRDNLSLKKMSPLMRKYIESLPPPGVNPETEESGLFFAKYKGLPFEDQFSSKKSHHGESGNLFLHFLQPGKMDNLTLKGCIRDSAYKEIDSVNHPKSSVPVLTIEDIMDAFGNVSISKRGENKLLPPSVNPFTFKIPNVPRNGKPLTSSSMRLNEYEIVDKQEFIREPATEKKHEDVSSNSAKGSTTKKPIHKNANKPKILRVRHVVGKFVRRRPPGAPKHYKAHDVLIDLIRQEEEAASRTCPLSVPDTVTDNVHSPDLVNDPVGISNCKFVEHIQKSNKLSSSRVRTRAMKRVVDNESVVDSIEDVASSVVSTLADSDRLEVPVAESIGSLTTVCDGCIEEDQSSITEQKSKPVEMTRESKRCVSRLSDAPSVDNLESSFDSFNQDILEYCGFVMVGSPVKKKKFSKSCNTKTQPKKKLSKCNSQDSSTTDDAFSLQESEGKAADSVWNSIMAALESEDGDRQLLDETLNNLSENLDIIDSLSSASALSSPHPATTSKCHNIDPPCELDPNAAPQQYGSNSAPVDTGQSKFQPAALSSCGDVIIRLDRISPDSLGRLNER